MDHPDSPAFESQHPAPTTHCRWLETGRCEGVLVDSNIKSLLLQGIQGYFSFITKWDFYWQNHCNLLSPIPLKATSYPWELQIPINSHQIQYVHRQTHTFYPPETWIHRLHRLTCTVELISPAKPPVTGASWLMSKRPVFTTDWKTKRHTDDYRTSQFSSFTAANQQNL